MPEKREMVSKKIDIEMTDKDGRGVAVLKLYGPSKRKENVVMINKSKHSDSKFVIKLAENIKSATDMSFFS